MVLERRDTVGGAAITETPFGPDFKVTALSYVVSLMPPTVMEELDLARHGYKIYPQHPYFVPYPDGRSLHDVRQTRHAAPTRSRVLGQGRRRDRALGRWLGRLGAVLGPLLTRVPPRSAAPRRTWSRPLSHGCASSTSAASWTSPG